MEQKGIVKVPATVTKVEEGLVLPEFGLPYDRVTLSLDVFTNLCSVPRARWRVEEFLEACGLVETSDPKEAEGRHLDVLLRLRHFENLGASRLWVTRFLRTPLGG